VTPFPDPGFPGVPEPLPVFIEEGVEFAGLAPPLCSHSSQSRRTMLVVCPEADADCNSIIGWLFIRAFHELKSATNASNSLTICAGVVGKA
jgi:hypothetical protein